MSGGDPNTGSGEHRFLTVPNVLSISRGLLAVPFAYVMLAGPTPQIGWGIAIMVVAAITDRLDGDVARKFHQMTEWGRILDPLADKLAVAVCILVILMLEMIPLWFVVAVIGRDLVILAGGVYIRQKRGVVLPSISAGKWAVGIVTLTAFFGVIGIGSPWMEIGLGASAVLLSISLAQYTKRFIEIIRAPYGTD